MTGKLAFYRLDNRQDFGYGEDLVIIPKKAFYEKC